MSLSEGFRGQFTPKLDNKGRVLIPSDFRKLVQADDPDFAPGSRARFAIVYGDPRRSFCECFTMREMRRLERRIGRMPSGSRARKLMEINYISMSLVVEIDDEGRIGLPPQCRAKLGVAQAKEPVDLVLAGMLDRFQIWTQSDYSADIAAHASPEDILAEGEDMLSLLPTEDDEEEG